MLCVCVCVADKPVFYNEILEVVSTTDTSITIKWHKLYLVQSSVAQFYGYAVIYKENDKQNYTEFTSVRHESKNDVFIVEIQGLKPNTEYDVTVKPYRNMNNVEDYGKAFIDIHTKTNCSGKFANKSGKMVLVERFQCFTLIWITNFRSNIYFTRFVS